MKSIVAALLVAVLVILPVADAFACPVDPGDAHATGLFEGQAPAQSHDEARKDGTPVPDSPDGTCAHNHCHHAAANISFEAAVGYDVARVVPFARHESTRASGVLEGLLRPPRS